MKMEKNIEVTVSVENMEEIIKIVEKAEKSIIELKEAIRELEEKKINILLES